MSNGLLLRAKVFLCYHTGINHVLVIEKYKKALEKAIEEAKTTHEAAPAMSNVPQPNRGPSRGVEAEQAKGAQSTAPADEDGWKTAHGSKRRHVTRGEESAPRAAPAAQQSQAPSAQAQAANANAPSAQKAVPTKAEAGSKANPAAVPKPTENPWVGKGKASSKVEPADDWRTEEAAKNTKFWLDSNGNWTTDQEKALESSPALTLTDVSGDEDEMPFPEDEEIDVSELEDGDKAKKDIDLNGPREAFSERRAAEIETLFADLIASCLENLDETIAAMTKKKVELLEEKARIEATIAALEKRLEEFKMGAEERVEAVDPYEEDIEALKEHL